MTTQPDRATPRTISTPRVGGIALALGAAVPVPTAGLALVWSPAEEVKPLLVPAAELLSALPGSFEHWFAPISLAMVCAVNGAVFALIAMASLILAGPLLQSSRRAG